MSVYVSGHKGLIGSNLVKRGAKPLSEANGLPEIVVNCAGFTRVDDCEHDTWNSYLSNVEHVSTLASYARPLRTYLIHLSTDFIFDGKDGPYTENARPAPLSVYGAQKWIAETLVKSVPKHLIVRTTCVYGWHPKKYTFAHWVKDKCEEHSTFYVTRKQITTPTYAPDLARIIMELVENNITGVVNVAGPEVMNRHTFAERLARAFGYSDADIRHSDSDSNFQLARRPLKGGLLVDRLTTGYEIEPQSVSTSLREMAETWGL